MKREMKAGAYVREGSGAPVAFRFRTGLAASEKIKFVSRVTDLVVGEDYNSVIRDVVFDFALITFFTDVDVSEITDSPESIDLIEDFVGSANIADIVRANMDAGLLEELEEAVDKNIEYRTGIHAGSLADALSRLASTVNAKLSGTDPEEMAELARRLLGMGGAGAGPAPAGDREEGGAGRPDLSRVPGVDVSYAGFDEETAEAGRLQFDEDDEG